MIKIAQNQQIILSILIKQQNLSSSEAHAEIIKTGSDVSLITIKRELSEMKDMGLIISSGAGRSVVYSISVPGRLFAEVDAKKYSALEPDKRFGQKSFNFELFTSIPRDLFFETEMNALNVATDHYRKNIDSLPKTIEEKELERFIIEFSWKSSRIEGNTYSLLDTEKLISRGVEAPGHDIHEARMILNHKSAFKFIREHQALFKEINLANIEEVHKILVNDLNVNLGLRERAVGVIGSLYRPLDTIHQIKEAVEALCKLINSIDSPHAKAMLAVLGISYIQPFEDGNKRTSRLIANAVLLSHGCAPLSYRSVSEDDYREAILAFYELNSLVAFKKIFIEQYVFSAENYAVATETSLRS